MLGQPDRRLGPCNHVEITLKTLMVFVRECRNATIDAQDVDSEGLYIWPAGPLELISLDTATSMADVFTSQSPMAICSVTSMRQCSGSGPPQSRAQAIMSAVGITDWWHARNTPIVNEHGEQEPPNQL